MVRNTLRRLGFISMLLLALVVAVPSAQAQGCDPYREALSQVALVSAVDSCPIDDCRDCGVVCADGCCHAPAVGVMNHAAAAMAPPVFEQPVGWADILGAPLGERSGLKRPPRV